MKTKDKIDAIAFCGVSGANIINGIMVQLTALKKAGDAKNLKDLGKAVLYEGVAIAMLGVGIAGMHISVVNTKRVFISNN